MVSVIYRSHDGTAREVAAEEGQTLMQAAISNGIDGIIGECGGSAMCATCHVYVVEAFIDKLPPLTDIEDEMLECTVAERRSRSRLACQIKITNALGGLAVDLPEAQA
ncbi:2Fe-2S iron-sulfur cluster-binding protein [Neorhizobium alkalisoli]|uniref:2Fe-2S iron-sulfur cluster-binding protein n=1 Tax=Neorhizobium alkalisoli TaxID=528178 RepID=UPI000CFA52F6|nr:2Fe-2S iron-sulfur cluster-binding protein [Neorhizobium alkalisoli]